MRFDLSILFITICLNFHSVLAIDLVSNYDLTPISQIFNNIYQYVSRTLNASQFKSFQFLKQVTDETSFTDWLNFQRSNTIHSIIKNILPNGAIVASPSTSDPNYYYQWTRDSALSIKTLIFYIQDYYNSIIPNTDVNSILNKKIKEIVELYIIHNYYLQRLPNRSGTFEDLSGLGEPKFNVDMTAFDENWGRPQRDGPALRSITILEFIHYLNQTETEFDDQKLKNRTFVFNEIIKPDLEYVIKYWDQKGFDLWEEVDSIHFYTEMVQLKALQLGFVWFDYYKDKIEGVDETFLSDLLSTFYKLKSNINNDFNFINHEKHHIVEIPSLLISGERGGLDIATTLGVIHTHELDFLEKYSFNNIHDLQSFRIPFQVNNTYVLNSLKFLIDDMQNRYTINHNPNQPKDNDSASIIGCGLGRYPEDIYDGHETSEGNPWFLATSTAGELIYQLIFNLHKFKLNLEINELNYEFYKPFIKNYETNKQYSKDIILKYNSIDFNETITNLFKYGDSFLEVVKRHSNKETGNMSEQFNRYTGFMQGAKELTWSYSALWNAIRWRDKLVSIYGI
ncbi:SGA1 [Candida pseudojiufengensis]|uniref:SGA1 n=1 Tax=Candida pseudojiufengensis TaxID=497109 RepID=UPI002224E463|nr:SGA1 [Candida pseudojiufengensis]KAI5959635.1 SGA1 [Candida pseudojiufengensis]